MVNKGKEVKGFSLYTATKSGQIFDVYGKEIKPRGKNCILWLVNDKGKYTSCRVGNLVLRAWKSVPPSNKHGCCHKDDNPWNNRLRNLRWGTQKLNMQDAIRNGTRGKNSPHAKAIQRFWLQPSKRKERSARAKSFWENKERREMHSARIKALWKTGKYANRKRKTK